MLMLTDADPQFDLRVQAAWRSHGEPTLLVVDQRANAFWRCVSAACTALALPYVLARRAPRSALRARGAGHGHAFAGLRRFVELQAVALQFFWRHRRMLCDAREIYAHDQTCGMVAALARLFYGVAYAYDAHEIVPFRPRRTGALRVRFEFAWERRIVRGARVCHVVNAPMRRIYRRLYGAANCVVRPNDFFADAELALHAAGRRQLVYVGATGAHRDLDRMVRLSRDAGCEVLLYCPDAERVAAELGIAGGHGLSGYRDALVARAAGQAPYFWCSFDPAVVSYRHSLPNKFFQAVALGIPIIVSDGTYLARLVRRHRFGMTIGAGAPDPARLWECAAYEAAVTAMREFRTALRAGRVVV